MLKTISLKFQNTTVDFLFYKYDKQYKPDKGFEFHKHLNYEIHFGLDGYNIYEFIDKKIALKKNQMLIIPPGTLHKLNKKTSDEYKFTVLTLKFSSTNPDGFYKYFNSAFQGRSLECLKIKEEIANAVLRLNKDVYLDKTDCLHSVYLTKCASDIIYRLCGLISDSNGKDALFECEKHLDFQIENLVNNPTLSLSDIAKKINYSPRQTERLIKKIYGKSLSEVREDFK